MHLYIGPKGARFVPIFGKSADFSEIFLGGVGIAAPAGSAGFSSGAGFGNLSFMGGDY